MINDFAKVSPLKILEGSRQKGLGKGNLGVLIARAGVGKTACLIHIAFDKLFRQDRLVHVSLEDGPEKVSSYYNVIFSDLVKAMNRKEEPDLRLLIERNRMILAYMHQSFEINRLCSNLQNLIEKVGFVPDAMLVDGLNFSKAGREIFENFKKIALDFQIEIWFSALAHQQISAANTRGIPYPCNHLDDLFEIIIQLQSDQSGVSLNLLKDHNEAPAPDIKVQLDPNTFLALLH
jgi:hypothetical protein